MKRFTDTEKWDKPWYRRLPAKRKCLWDFLCDRCDSAGVWEIDLETASHYIGEPITEEDLLALGEHVTRLPKGKLWVHSFISFQYGKLSSTCRPHEKVLAALRNHGLDASTPDTLSVTLDTLSHTRTRVSDTRQEEEEDMEEEEDKDKEGGPGETKPQPGGPAPATTHPLPTPEPPKTPQDAPAPASAAVLRPGAQTPASAQPARSRGPDLPNSPEQALAAYEAYRANEIAFGRGRHLPSRTLADATAFFLHYEAQKKTGADGKVFWVRANDQVVRDWLALLAGWGAAGKPGANPGQSLRDLQGKLDAKTRRLADLRQKSKFHALAAEEQGESTRLPAEIDNLKKQMAA